MGFHVVTIGRESWRALWGVHPIGKSHKLWRIGVERLMHEELNRPLLPAVQRLPWKTGVAMESLLLVTIGSRQQRCPRAGSRDARELSLHTINWRLPPAVIIMGELLDPGSSSAFQTSFPVSLSKAKTLALGFAPVKTISNDPSIKGEGRHDISATWYFRPMFFSHTTVPVFTSRQCVLPLAPTA
jgi:hypothetical protein